MVKTGFASSAVEPSLSDRLMALAHSDGKCVITLDRVWVYAEFVADAEQAAKYFRKMHVNRILIHLQQGYFAYVLTWAAYLAGTTFCNVGEGTPSDRILRYIDTFEPDLVISEDALGISETPREFFQRIASGLVEPTDSASSIDPMSTAYVLFTSGSTGQPKGVMIARKSLDALVSFALKEYGVTKDDVWAQYSSIGFDLSVLDVFVAVAAGAALVPIATHSEKLMPSSLIVRHSITIWHSVPSAFELIDHSRRLTEYTLASIRLVLFCGEKLYPTLLARMFAVKSNLIVYNNFGPTEATIFCTFQRLTSRTLTRYSRETVSIGQPVQGTFISLENFDGHIGELVVSGVSVGKGYLDSAQQHGFNFEFNSLFPTAYRTGDFCCNDDGNLYFVCRKDRQVKISGYRVDLSEIDFILRAEGCESAISLFDSKAIVSFVLGGTRSADELSKALSRQLPSYYIPSNIHMLDSFPYTLSGKIDTELLLKRAKEDENG